MERFNAWIAPICFGVGVGLLIGGAFRTYDNRSLLSWIILLAGAACLVYYYLYAKSARARRF